MYWKFIICIVYSVKARECTSQSDCSSIQGTSCVRDGIERVMRCLCGNNKPPLNGYCSNDGDKRKYINQIFDHFMAQF